VLARIGHLFDEFSELLDGKRYSGNLSYTLETSDKVVIYWLPDAFNRLLNLLYTSEQTGDGRPKTPPIDKAMVKYPRRSTLRA
jgi:hypothetical protein